jgi:hypothetical protein
MRNNNPVNGFNNPLMRISNLQPVRVLQQNFIYQPNHNLQGGWLNHNQSKPMRKETNATAFQKLQHSRRHGMKGIVDATEAKELTGSNHVIPRNSFRNDDTLGPELDSQGEMAVNSNGVSLLKLHR